MNELVHVFRDFFDLHLEEFRFLDAAKAFKNMVVFLNDAGELGDNRNEIKSKMEFLQSRVPLMNFEEVQGVSAILLYVKRRLAATDDGPRYGEGLSREPTAEEKAFLKRLRNGNGDSLGSLAGSSEKPDGFIDDLRSDDLDGE